MLPDEWIFYYGCFAGVALIANACYRTYLSHQEEEKRKKRERMFG